MSVERRGLFLTALTMMSATGLFATDIYLPALPQMTQYFNCSQSEIQASFTVFLLGLAGCQLVYGALSDRFGRKRILICGLSLFVLTSILCATAVSLTQFIAFRLLQAAGGGAGSVICRAIVINRYSRTESVKIFSTIFPVIGLSAAVAPLIGGYLTYFFDWRASFYFMALFGLASIGLVIAFLPEASLQATGGSHNPALDVSSAPSSGVSNNPDTSKSTRSSGMQPSEKTINASVGANASSPRLRAPFKFSSYLDVLKNIEFLGYVFILCAGFAVFRCYTVESPFVFDKQGYLVEEMSHFYIGLSIAYLVGNLTAKRLVNTRTVEQVIRFGFFFSVLGGISMVLGAFYFENSPYAVILPMSVITLGNGFLFPTSSAGAMSSVPQAFSGMASGVMGALQFVIAALCVHWVGQLCCGNAQTMSLYIGSIILIGLCSFLGLVYRTRERVTTT